MVGHTLFYPQCSGVYYVQNLFKIDKENNFCFIGFLTITNMVIVFFVWIHVIFGPSSDKLTEEILNQNGRYRVESPDSCGVFNSVGIFFTLASMLVLFGLTVDLIKKPLHSQSKVFLIASLLVALLFALLSSTTYQVPTDDSDAQTAQINKLVALVSSHPDMDLPPEDDNGSICLWTYNQPNWMQLELVLGFFSTLTALIMSFARCIQDSKQDVGIGDDMHKVPKMQDNERTIFHFPSKDHEKGKSKNLLLSNVQTSTYILIILCFFMTTWIPFFAYSWSWTIGYENLIERELVTAKSNGSLTSIFTCLNMAIQNKECNVVLKESITQNEIEEITSDIFNLERSFIIEDISCISLSLFSTLFIPLLVLFFYFELD